MIRQQPPRTKGTYAQIPNPVQRFGLRILDFLDGIVYTLVGIAFLLAAGMALTFAVGKALHSFFGILPDTFPVQTVLDFVSDLLLVLIIMEVLGTIRSYLEKGDSAVTPFLFIGIISATRGILSIGAQLSITGNTFTDVEFHNKLVELAVNAAIIVALGVTLRIMGNLAASEDKKVSIEDGQSSEGGLVERVTVEANTPAYRHTPAIERQPDTLARDGDRQGNA